MSVRKSASYILGGSFFSKIVSFVGSIFLARILFPEDYAYILIANIFTGLVQILSDVGFENYYLQARFKNHEEEDETLRITSFLRLGLNTLLFVIQFVISYVVEYYYREVIVGQLLRVFSLNYLIVGIGVTSQFILRKELNFKPEAVANVFRDIVGTAVKIAFAIQGFGALSFGMGSLAGSFVRVLIIMKAKFYLPYTLHWDKVVFNKIIFFGKHSFVGGVGLYFVRQADKFLLSRFFPREIVGFYSFSESQASIAYSYLVQPLNGLFLSFSAKYKENKEYLYSVLIKISFLISAILLPLTILLFFFSNEIFFYVFGEKWMGAVTLFRLFLVYNYTIAFVEPVSGVLTAFGFPDINAKLIWARGVALVVFLSMAAVFNLPIIVYAGVFLIISFLFTWIKAYLCIKKMEGTLIGYLLSQKAALYSAFLNCVTLFIVSILVDELLIRIVLSGLGVVLIFFVINVVMFSTEFLGAIKLLIGNNILGKRIFLVVEKTSSTIISRFKK